MQVLIELFSIKDYNQLKPNAINFAKWLKSEHTSGGTGMKSACLWSMLQVK